MLASLPEWDTFDIFRQCAIVNAQGICEHQLMRSLNGFQNIPIQAEFLYSFSFDDS
jgi:hypothetical protein